MEGNNGYWLLSSNPNTMDDANIVDFFGRIFASYTSNFSDYGIRPVITVSKSYLK